MTYAEYLFGSAPGVTELELVEISHISFSQVWRLVRNQSDGVTVTHSVGGAEFVYEYVPMRIRQLGSSGDLDQELQVQIGDVGEILPDELDAVFADATFREKPLFRYRTYRSDDLTEPMYGPDTFEIVSLAFSREGCSFKATPKRTNVNRTGFNYTLNKFPMLRAFFHR